MDKILEQYNGNLESYILAIGDATDLTVNLSTFSDPELLGLRDLMVKQDIVRIRRFAKLKNIKLEE